jgi:hypothetical protein
VHVRSLQSWEGGINFPTAQRLHALVSVLLQTGGLAPGHEELEAERLWDTAICDAPRLSVPFDSKWFRTLLGASSQLGAHAEESTGRAPVPELRINGPVQVAARREDWADAPDVSRSVGRSGELATLRAWVLEQHCQVVQLSGMGGIGKTTVATRLATELAPAFELVYWRSLKFAPSASDWLAGAIAFIAGNDVPCPDREADRIGLLVSLLGDRRCLMVLDNLETVLEPGDCQGRFRDSFEGYCALLSALGERRHQGCLILTSREACVDLGLITTGAVRSLELSGLGVDDAHALLHDEQLTGTDLDWADFVARCGGNGLALKLTAETVRELFCGDIAAFLLAVGSNCAIHGGVRRLLGSQLDQRLSSVEREVVHLLAESSQPLPTARILAELGPRIGRGAVMEALLALRRRSLIECGTAPAGHSLHPVVRDYITVQSVTQSAAQTRMSMKKAGALSRTQVQHVAYGGAPERDTADRTGVALKVAERSAVRNFR